MTSQPGLTNNWNKYIDEYLKDSRQWGSEICSVNGV